MYSFLYVKLCPLNRSHYILPTQMPFFFFFLHDCSSKFSSTMIVLGCNLKNDRMISVCFQGKPFIITVIQIYALNSNAEEAEVEWFYEDLQDLLELTAKKMSFSL